MIGLGKALTVVGGVAAAGERRPAIVALVDPDRILPHAFLRLDRRHHLPNHAVHVENHRLCPHDPGSIFAGT